MDGMDVTILDSNFNIVGIVDDYQSLIWTERYNKAGDFEIAGDLNSTLAQYCKIGYYARINKSDTVMVIEGIDGQEKIRSENKLIVKGRSIESILDRRIVWGFVTLSGNVQDVIKQLLTDNVISPSRTERAIPNFIFQTNDDANIANCNLSSIQFDGDNIYDTVCALCQSFNLGFRIRLLGNIFVFYLYSGTDRSCNQTDNPYVIFSEDYDNIIESRYSADKTPYKNVALVNGEALEQPSGGGDDHNKFRVIAGDEMVSGLNRFETCIDSGLSSTDAQTGEQLSTEEYTQQVIQKGNEELAKLQINQILDGKIVEDYFVYGRDYWMGDLLQYKGIYNISSPVRITEFIRCLDTSGYKEYPSYILTEGGNNNG